jgi:DNA-binding YbaB/EbfC family protein
MTSPMPDLGALLAQAQQMQQSMVQAQQDVESMQATGTSGGGLVSAVVDGRYDLVSLRIADDAVDLSAEDALDDLADLVVAAVRDAKSEVERLAAERMGAATTAISSLGEALGGSSGGLGGLESLVPPGLFGGPSTTDEPDDDGVDR